MLYCGGIPHVSPHLRSLIDIWIVSQQCVYFCLLRHDFKEMNLRLDALRRISTYDHNQTIKFQKRKISSYFGGECIGPICVRKVVTFFAL